MTKVPAQFTQLEELLVEPTLSIGTVVSMDYQRAVIVSDDNRTRAVGGLPQRTFLLAVPQREAPLQEVILLSIANIAPLETVRSFQTLREDYAITEKSPNEIDERAQKSLRLIGFSCDILGTFYYNEAGQVRFGADVDQLLGNSLFKVYKPRGAGLSMVASFSNKEAIDGNALLPVGHVRYSETERIKDVDAKAFINVKDFIGKKSFIAGTTRSGKSNSIKTIVKKVHQYSHSPGVTPIAQIIFDPQGEYANDNPQDGEALVNISDESEVSIYKVLKGEPENPKVHPLQYNLYDDENLELTWELFKQELANRGTDKANYTARMTQMDFIPPDPNATGQQRQSEYTHWARKKLGLYSIMFYASGEKKVKPFFIRVGKDMASKAVDDLSVYKIDKRADDSSELKLKSTKEAAKVLEWIWDHKDALSAYSDSWLQELEDGDLKEFSDQILNYTEKGYTGVIAGFQRIQEFHSPYSKGDIRANVWRDIQAGKLIVIDLSRGSQKATQTLSETIVHYLVSQASIRFTSNQANIPFQLVVEEAHNLFDRDTSKTDADPWVRLSKEASKYDIGLLYATQEVTSVDQRILSNTSNWIVAALNSKIEARELSNYYNFEPWLDQIMKVETKGFVRMKTESSPYIIPVQIELFSARDEEFDITGSPLQSMTEELVDDKIALIEEQSFETPASDPWDNYTPGMF